MENQVTLAIVDDNSIYRKLLTKILNRAGIAVVFYAEDGVDCLLKMETTSVLPNILLMDIEMPVMDGFETARQMKLRWPELKIIAHSSVIDAESIRRITVCGADMFLPKNCSSIELISAIEQFQQ